MESNILEIEYKNWFKFSLSLLALAAAVVAGIYLEGMYSSGTLHELPLLLSIWIIFSFSAVILVGIITPPHFMLNKIIFHPDRIEEKGLFSKTISYDNIQRMQISDQGAKIYGPSFFNNIFWGSQYKNADTAVELAKSKAKEFNVELES